LSAREGSRGGPAALQSGRELAKERRRSQHRGGDGVGSGEWRGYRGGGNRVGGAAIGSEMWAGGWCAE
jgi:hypothetical protein